MAIKLTDFPDMLAPPWLGTNMKVLNRFLRDWLAFVQSRPDPFVNPDRAVHRWAN